VDLHNNLRSKFIKFFLMKPSITYNKQFLKRWLYTNFKILLKINHIVDSNISTLSSLGIKNDGKGLDFYLNKNELKKIRSLPINFENYSSLIVGAKHYTKRLPLKKLIELCDKINGPIVLIGGKDEVKVAKKIENFFNSTSDKDDKIKNKLNKKTTIYNLCGKLSIQGSACVIKLSKQVFSHDTGFMHISAALNKKTYAIFGSTHHNLMFYPYNSSFSILENKNLYCRPCTKIGLSKCPVNHFKCMNEIKFDII